MIVRLKNPLKNILNDQRGDTLIEVLICILIVTVILSGAYVTTHKSSEGVRNSQEHAEALKLAQSQLEEVRQNAGITSGSTVFTFTPPFCMVNVKTVSATIAPDSTKCVQDSSGNPATDAPYYKVTINRSSCNPVGTKCWLFSVKVTWDTVTNGGQSTEQISYRIHDDH
jgi:prepilin-type N-terminal cleavage/methylation domain-containing protein